jgi:cysteinyl-tRNA synthetase
VGDYAAADALRARVRAAGFALGDTTAGPVLSPLADDANMIGRSTDVASNSDATYAHTFSVALLAHNNREDLERCVRSVARHAGERGIELVVLENGSTDETFGYVRALMRAGNVGGVPVRAILADHDLGFAAARNATFRACLGRYIVQLDTSIELAGDIWTPLEQVLQDERVGVVGPFGLVSRNLKEYEEDAGPDVDAIEGYLFAFRRMLLNEVGPADEHFRFYRMMDVDYSLEFKRAGYRVVVSPTVAQRVIRHPLREWHSLTPEEQATRSKKNFDLYWKRRHHAQSLLVANFPHGHGLPWGHDHDRRDPALFDPRYEHEPLEGAVEHTHPHRHWPDHAHSHPHRHEANLSHDTSSTSR